MSVGETQAHHVVRLPRHLYIHGRQAIDTPDGLDNRVGIYTSVATALNEVCGAGNWFICEHRGTMGIYVEDVLAVPAVDACLQGITVS
jgi:hypothetical protein